MSKSQSKILSPAAPGQTKTMFVTAGTPAAVLTTSTIDGDHCCEDFWFPHPLHAFEWALKHGANFVFSQAAPNN